MSVDATSEEVRELLETALSTQLDATENPRRDRVEAWDSLTHLELVFLLEERFDARFSEEEIVEMSSLESILAVLKAKHAA
jgi:acyl carrier protein